MQAGPYTIHDVVSLTGLPVRRIHYYREIGLLDPPLGGRGLGARYTDKHVRELRYLVADLESIPTLSERAERRNHRRNPDEDD